MTDETENEFTDEYLTKLFDNCKQGRVDGWGINSADGLDTLTNRTGEINRVWSRQSNTSGPWSPMPGLKG